jgi:hypothetical protein
MAAAAPAAWAASIDESSFRYARGLDSPGSGPVLLEPDGLLYAHAQPGLVDLRIVDAAGRQVPWRALPEPLPAPPVSVTVLNRGHRGGKAVALLDLGAGRRVHDRIELAVPDRDFVGRVTVYGSDDREAFTRLSTTVIYDVAGAESARSTTALFAPSDFRYLDLVATGISAIEGATVSAAQPRPALLARRGRRVTVRQQGQRTVASVDLGFRNLPVDAVRVSADTGRYDRRVLIEGSNDGHAWIFLADARIFRLEDSVPSAIPVEARFRSLRLTIENGDDDPLAGIRVEALARARPVLVADGYQPPFRLLYGNSSASAPSYDYARLPRETLALERALPGVLGAEKPNPLWEPAPDTRSFFARHPALVQAALALGAAIVAVGGLLVLRPRAAERA